MGTKVLKIQVGSLHCVFEGDRLLQEVLFFHLALSDTAAIQRRGKKDEVNVGTEEMS